MSDKPLQDTPSIHIFIISWAGQHDRAIAIANEIIEIEKKVSIVYSDPDPDISLDVQCDLIKRPDHLFWGDKFSASLEACDEDIMLVIHSDCYSNDWKEIVKSSLKAHTNIPNIAVWAPLIDGTPYPLHATNILPINDTSLHIVAETDAIVFSITQHSIQRMKKVDYRFNVYGWGFAPLFCANAFVANKFVVVDKSVSVTHFTERGYPRDEALTQLMEFKKQFTTFETIQDHLLMNIVNMNKRKISQSPSV